MPHVVSRTLKIFRNFISVFSFVRIYPKEIRNVHNNGYKAPVIIIVKIS